MIQPRSIRWRLVAWVSGVLVAVSAVTFLVVYEQTGHQLRAQIDHDVTGDATQLSQAVRTLRSQPVARVLTDVGAYLRAQPFTATSSLLFASIPGYGAVSNHPEIVGQSAPDDGESSIEQAHENALGRALIAGPTGLSTRQVADIGSVRFDERTVRLGDLAVRVGAGEPLVIVSRAQRSIARSFAIAGALALVLALIASYLAGASVSRPLRRMARIAARVNDGDLSPRMRSSQGAGTEMQVLADSFNNMLDRLAAAFDAQRGFIADASHELRTPLTVIGGQMEVLAAQKDPPPEEIQRVQRVVGAEIARTSRLVDDMLVLVRSEQQDFLRTEEIDLRPYVADLWSATTLGHDRRFELGHVPDARLTADPDRLAQALRNLIRNAVEHTSAPDGLVRLDVETRPGGRARFVVLDDGPGIDPDQLDQVFERFYRTDSGRARVAGGAGLGLAIVLAIAHAHGGDARALPSERGARILLELPGLHAAPAATAWTAGSQVR